MAGPASLIMSLIILVLTTPRTVEGLARICRMINPMHIRDQRPPENRGSVGPRPAMHIFGFEAGCAVYLIGRCAQASLNILENSLGEVAVLRSVFKIGS